MPRKHGASKCQMENEKTTQILAKKQLKSCLNIQFQCVVIVLTFILIELPYRVEMRCI